VGPRGGVVRGEGLAERGKRRGGILRRERA